MSKRVRFLLIGLAAALVLAPMPEAAAVSGRCKDRDSYSAAWRANGFNFEQCKAQNQQRDGDNVFDQRGLVWWDVNG